MTTETVEQAPQEPEPLARCHAEGCKDPARRVWQAPAYMVDADTWDLCGAHWEELAESVRTAGRVR